MKSHQQRRPHLSRRAFLGGLGAATALSPFIPLLNASGDVPTAPTRLVLFFTPHGTIWNNWVPTGTTTNFTLPSILQPLAKHQNKIVVIDGLAMHADGGPGAPHTKGPPLLWTGSPLLNDMTFTRSDGSGGMYFGWNSGPSFDQVIANKLNAKVPYKSLEFGVLTGGNSFPGSRMIYSGASQPKAPEDDPQALFTSVFASTTATQAQIKQLNAERGSVLDLVTTELNALNGVVSTADQMKIQAHLQAVRDVETSLQATACKPPSLGAKVSPGAIASVPTIFDQQIQLLAASLACDLTRVASLQYRVGENDGMAYEWIGIGDEHHITTHDTSDHANGECSSIYQWYASKFSSLLDALDAIPEGDGTVLDHTMVIWGSELGTASTHDFGRMPFVVAGGGGGTIKTGRFLQFKNTFHNRLLVSAFHTMGLSDVQSFGSLDTDTGPLEGLSG